MCIGRVNNALEGLRRLTTPAGSENQTYSAGVGGVWEHSNRKKTHNREIFISIFGQDTTDDLAHHLAFRTVPIYELKYSYRL